MGYATAARVLLGFAVERYAAGSSDPGISTLSRITSVSASPDRNQRWSVAAVAVDDKDAAELLWRCFAEMTSRYLNRTARSDEIAAAMAEDPSDDLTPPGGLFLLAWFGDRPAGCVGLRRRTAQIAEITRLFVCPEARGLGGGSQLLTAVEQHAKGLGVTTPRLDTCHDLIEARRLYVKHGYARTQPYSDAPYADHWFQKRLA
jgi:GNAT superfamily N-acetyltransferase